MKRSSASDVIETVVERIEDFDKASSYFIAVNDTRLELRRYVKGNGPYTRLLRATALPVGRYEVIGNEVVHRWDPKAAPRELAQQQQLRRMRSPEFLAVVKRIAKAVGGRATKWMRQERRWLGYTIAPKRGRAVDVEKLQRRFIADAAVIFDDRGGALVVVCADTFPDAIALAFADDNHQSSHLHALFSLVDQECGIAAITEMGSRAIEIRTTRVPAKPARLLAVLAIHGGAGEGTTSAASWKRSLAEKRLLFWWDI